MTDWNEKAINMAINAGRLPTDAEFVAGIEQEPRKVIVIRKVSGVALGDSVIECDGLHQNDVMNSGNGHYEGEKWKSRVECAFARLRWIITGEVK